MQVSFIGTNFMPKYGENLSKVQNIAISEISLLVISIAYIFISQSIETCIFFQGLLLHGLLNFLIPMTRIITLKNCIISYKCYRFSILVHTAELITKLLEHN